MIIFIHLIVILFILNSVNHFYNTFFLHIGQVFQSFSHSQMHSSWYKCLHLRATAVSPAENSVQQMGQLDKKNKTYGRWKYSFFLAIVQIIPSKFLQRLCQYSRQVRAIAELGLSYLIRHIVCVRLLIKIHNLNIMCNHKFLHILVHKTTHLQKIFGLIPVINKFLVPSSMSHQSFNISLVALDHFFVLLFEYV